MLFKWHWTLLCSIIPMRANSVSGDDCTTLVNWRKTFFHENYSKISQRTYSTLSVFMSSVSVSVILASILLFRKIFQSFVIQLQQSLLSVSRVVQFWKYSASMCLDCRLWRQRIPNVSLWLAWACSLTLINQGAPELCLSETELARKGLVQWLKCLGLPGTWRVLNQLPLTKTLGPRWNFW